MSLKNIYTHIHCKTNAIFHRSAQSLKTNSFINNIIKNKKYIIIPIQGESGESAIDYSLEFGRMDDLPAVESIGADMVDSSELDQYLTMGNQYPSTSSSCVDPAEQYYYHARYHELQPNTTKQHFSVHQTSYQPSYQYVVNNCYNN